MSTVLLDASGNPLPTARQRELTRLRLDARSRASELAAAYDAAQTTDENSKHWRYADDLSAAAANSIQVRRTLRKRARYECLQANSFGWGIVQTLANDTVSTGPTLKILLQDSQAARQIERAWQHWVRRSGLIQKLRTARLAKCVDGEAFLLRTTNPKINCQVQLDVKLIEADQVATPAFFEGKPGAVDGIVYDRYGNPAVYHVLKQHPGDVWVVSSLEKEDIQPVDMIHMFSALRPGQARGVPEVTPALPLFAMLRRYTLATILSAEIAADFSAVIQTTANAIDSTGQTTDTSVQPFDSVQIDRGMMTSLPYGWTLNQLDPKQPVTNYEMFRNAILHEIARSVHMPANKALGDSSNYSSPSARLDHQIYYQAIDIERSEWEVRCLDRIFEWWLDEALLIPGYLPAFDAMDEVAHRWMWPPVKAANPVDEANAAKTLIDAGLMTEEQYLSQQGVDVDAHYQQLDEQFNRRWRLGMLSQEQVMVMQLKQAADQQAQSQSDVKAEKVSDTAMNGAQVTAASQIVAQVAAGLMPRDSGVAQLMFFFQLSREQAEQIMGTAGTPAFKPVGDPLKPAEQQIETDPNASQDDMQADEPASTGEFAGLSRMQWNRNRKAIMDVLKEFASGAISRTMAEVLLGGIGLGKQSIDALLDDAADGTVDSVPQEEQA